MTTELTMLLWSAVLCLALPNVPVIGLTSLPGGLAWGVGNRGKPMAGEPEWLGRARRAHANLVENLVVFAALVLTAYVAGRLNYWTALGSQLFFWGRLAHAVTYIGGLVPWRTLAFGVAVAGMWMIAIPLLFG
jgi:uncharacterized MAPEG superfamily protein